MEGKRILKDFVYDLHVRVPWSCRVCCRRQVAHFGAGQKKVSSNDDRIIIVICREDGN